MTTLEKAVLRELQMDFPLSPRPFREIAERLKISGEQFMRAARRLENRGVIRYIGAALNLNKLGFASTLVAMSVPAAKIKSVARLINSYPQVSHNYLREGEYNVWFTISAPSRRSLAAIVKEIRERTGIKKMLDLRTKRVYKIDARFRTD